VSWLTDGDSQQQCYCFKRRRERLLLFPSPPCSFLFFRFQWFPFILPVCFLSFLPRFKLFLPLSLGLLVVLFGSVLSLLFRFVFLFLCVLFFFSSLRFVLSSPLFSSRAGVESLFIGPRERGSSLLRMGSRAAPVGWPVGAAGKARLPWFLIIKGRGASVLDRARGKRERGNKIKEEKKQKLSFFPCCMSRGRRKRNNVVQNNTVLLSPFKKKKK